MRERQADRLWGGAEHGIIVRLLVAAELRLMLFQFNEEAIAHCVSEATGH